MAETSPSSERFTDEEWAFLRRVRFGELPGRIRPEEMVELIDTGPPPGLPWRPLDPLAWGGGGSGYDDGDGD